MRHKDCLVFRADMLVKMGKAYQFIKGIGLSKQQRAAIKPDYQGFYFLLIFKPYEDNEWSKKIEGCKDCFMPAKIEGIDKPHTCGKTLRCGPFYRYKSSVCFFCPGCFATFPDKAIGRFLCHIISEHGSWGETTDSFLLVQQKSIWQHLRKWKKLQKEKKSGEDEDLSWQGVITSKEFCYHLAPVAIPDEIS